MIYAFADYELDRRRYELRRCGESVRIEPQVFDLLAYLIEQRDRVALKSELLERLWPGRFVGEATLSHCVMAARKAVGDNGRVQRVIKTLHARGYRFVAPVIELQSRSELRPTL
jgi:DNA-binding winged helix-turn-helix (wHTH) protein